MRVLYHLWLSPFSRKVRVVLREKNLDFTLKTEKVWERRPEFLALSPAGEVPVLIEPDGTVLADTTAIVEYLDEVYREKILIGINPVDRAEVRRLAAWFDVKMNLEVTENLLGEKMMKRLTGLGQPNSLAIRAGHANLPYHLDYLGYLVERRRWLAGDHFSVADITNRPRNGTRGSNRARAFARSWPITSRASLRRNTMPTSIFESGGGGPLDLSERPTA
jgi:glutathione S-transferase